MKKLILAGSCIFLTTLVTAQHCPYDGDEIIMIKVNHTAKLKDQFRMELLDSTEKSIPVKRYNGKGYDTINAVFWKNPPIGLQGAGDYSKPEKINYRFVKAEYYIITDIPYLSKYKLRVIYTGKGRKYKPVILDLPNEAVHRLCTSNSRLWNGSVAPYEVAYH